MLPLNTPWISTNYEEVKDIFQGQTEERVHRKGDIHPEAAWYDIQKALETTVMYTTI